MTTKNNRSAPSRVGASNMFDQISPTYDLVNSVMTFRLDRYWRRKMLNLLPQGPSLQVLDCATGTGDQAICLMEKSNRVSNVVAVDLANDMLAIGRKKIAGKPYEKDISFQTASALELPFKENSFDAITVSFGIRNVTDVAKALSEFNRVLKPAGRVLMLEGTVPENRLLRAGHLFYLRHFLPRIGGWISNNRDAYRYLNETIETFPQGEAFCDLMKQAGLTNVRAHPLSGGMATIYSGDKPHTVIA